MKFGFESLDNIALFMDDAKRKRIYSYNETGTNIDFKLRNFSLAKC